VWWIVGAAVALVLIAIGLYVLITAGEEETDDAQVAADVVPVGARVPGQVLRVAIVENQEVAADQVIAELDPADHKARLEQAQAELASAQAQAQASDAQVQIAQASSRGGLASAQAAYSAAAREASTSDAQVAAARADVARARAQAQLADVDLRRMKALAADGAIPRQQLDNTVAAQASAQAALRQAEAQLRATMSGSRAAESRVGEAQGRVSQQSTVVPQIAVAQANAALAHARVRQNRAAAELARLQLAYTTIRAPTAGRASRLQVHKGQQVLAGQPIIQLVPLQTYVIANFKETEIGRMREGQAARIEVDAFKGRKLSGRVQSLSGGTGATFALIPPENATGNFVKVVQRVPVRIEWVDLPADLHMRAGLSVTVTVFVGR
jgi:membrane fusion protein (multidrug efflux system)